jgi:hypothetical protein
LAQDEVALIIITLPGAAFTRSFLAFSDVEQRGFVHEEVSTDLKTKLIRAACQEKSFPLSPHKRAWSYYKLAERVISPPLLGFSIPSGWCWIP